MPNEINQEQAVKIAEWIGARVKGNHWRFKGKKWDSAESVIGSDSGEVAMILKILEVASIHIEVHEFDPNLFDLHTEHFDKRKFNLDAEIIGKPLNIALQLAILAMLKGKKCK